MVLCDPSVRGSMPDLGGSLLHPQVEKLIFVHFLFFHQGLGAFEVGSAECLPIQTSQARKAKAASATKLKKGSVHNLKKLLIEEILFNFDLSPVNSKGEEPSYFKVYLLSFSMTHSCPLL